MSKHPLPPADMPGENYELQLSINSTDDEPLLPRYERHSQPSISPHRQHEFAKRKSNFRKVVSCFCLTLLVLVPMFALAGCWYGRTTLEKVRTWDQLPPEWKSWLDDIAPGRIAPDHGNFPTDIGYAGPTPTGKEAALLATAPALPIYTGIHPLIPPSTKTKGSFNIMQHWGNLSPFYSVDSHGLPESSSLIPDGCELEELHWLQRHGARYPTLQNDGPAGLASRLREAKGWKGKHDLKFLNDWEFKLGAEVLTPFGRKQLFDLGVSARMKYGFLLDRMESKLPVFRTESQDRMLKSAQNFAAGFFGVPAEDQYNLEVTIESPGFNNTLAPWNTCPYRNGTGNVVAFREMVKWDAVFLKDAHKRLAPMLEGYDLSIRDVKDFMDMCAYETVALGYSSFCNMFNQKEWRGYQYRNDIFWWYASSFGLPGARAMGKGWAQELLSRLTHTRLTQFDSTTNSTFHNDVHFPLRDSLYVDFTHDTQFALLLPTLNLTTFGETGDPPTDHIPKHRSFVSSKFAPFAANLQVQVLSCHKRSDRQIRVILNDAPVPLTGITGCGEDDEGMCDLPRFVESVQSLVDGINFSDECIYP